jgi:tetratricopeptide (TPR) repeat protein
LVAVRSEHLARAADAAHELGFGAAEAHHLANLGRAQQQLGDQRSATVTLERAIDTALSTGDLRTAALARVRLGRVLGCEGDRESAHALVQSALQWYRAAGGGEGVGLAEYVLAAARTHRPGGALSRAQQSRSIRTA